MSFIERNQYFFRNELQSKTKGLSQSERERFYKKELQLETRKRLKEYFRENLDATSKVKDFDHVLTLLKDLEFEYILLSMYFDKDSDALFRNLGKVLSECTPNNFVDTFKLTSLYNNSSSRQQASVDYFLKPFFLQYFDVSEKEWLNKDINYDLIKKANAWLGISIRTNKTVEYITLGLIHYTKLWSLYFSNPYQYDKGIMLLNEILILLKGTSESERVLFKRVLLGLSSILNNLACQVPATPFFDLRDREIMKPGYIKKLDDVVRLLDDKGSIHQVSSGPTYKELITQYFGSDFRGQAQTFDKIRNKLLLGVPMTIDEMNFLESCSSSARLRKAFDTKRLHKEIIRMHYSYVDLTLH